MKIMKKRKINTCTKKTKKHSKNDDVLLRGILHSNHIYSPLKLYGTHLLIFIAGDEVCRNKSQAFRCVRHCAEN